MAMWWFLDDGNAYGQLGALDRLLGRLRPALGAVGLQVNLGKTAVVTRSSLEMYESLSMVKRVDPSPDENGVLVLGAPIGGPLFVEVEVDVIVDKCEHFCSAILKLGDPQIATVLLRFFGGTCRLSGRFHLNSSSSSCSVSTTWWPKQLAVCWAHP